MKINERSIKELKQKYLDWVESVRVRKAVYDQAKNVLRLAQGRLIVCKKIYNKSYSNWVQARKEVVKAKNKWESYPYDLREWSKKHFGLVMEGIEKGAEK